ncbi:MAG: extracellular solute-binding protein [Patescibacteria group bacterium]
MKMLKKIAFVFFLSLAALGMSGASCTGGGGQGYDPKLFEPVTLRYWRVFDGPDTLAPIIEEYSKLHPNVSIQYKKLRYEEYENELLQAFSEDRGPDIVSLHSTWMDKYLSKLAPMPPAMRVGFTVEEGAVKKKMVQKVVAFPGYAPNQIREQFADAVGQDVIRPTEGVEAVYGLPFALDTLSLFYNKDFFDNAGIADPPRTWSDFQNAIKLIARRDSEDDTRLSQSAAAIGTADNIQRSFDILSTIMMQNGAQMSYQSRVLFDQTPYELGQRTITPAADSLRFYTDFAYPGKDEIYTWNADMPDNVEAFALGRTAMMFGYAYQAATVKKQTPRLRFGIMPMPQLDPSRPVTSANYWIEAVTKKAASQDYAWDFLRFATGKEQVKNYLAATGKPTALRSLLPEQQSQEAVAPFASQVLYAKSWYHGKNPGAAEAAFREMMIKGLEARGGAGKEQTARLEGIVARAKQLVQASY